MLIFVSVGMTCFSEDTFTDYQRWGSESLECLGKGTNLLLSNEPMAALEYFQKGHNLAAQSQSDSDVLDFYLYFSEAVVLDIFGLKEQCMQSIASMLHTIEAIDNEDEEEYDWESDREVDFEKMQKSEDLIQNMSSLAAMAPSSEVRAALFSVIQQIGDEMLPLFQFADPVYLQEAAWNFYDSNNNEFSFELCKKHKKKKSRLERYEEKVGIWFDKCVKWIKRAKEIKEIYDAFMNS